MRPAALLVAAGCLTGCPDTHQMPDAAMPPDAWGDVGPVDAFVVPACQVEGRPVASLPGSLAELTACSCAEGTIPGIGLSAPAPLAREHGPFALCTPPRSAARIIASLCAEGQVVHHFQGRRSEAAGVNFTAELLDGDGCMDAASCLFAEQQLPADMRPGCLYPDYTLAVTGVVPPAGDCAALRAEGLCTVGCPCTEDGDFPQCFGLSESQSVGVCAAAPYCLDPVVPCFPGQSCLIFSSPPPVAEDIESALHAGRCVPASACTAFASRATGTWTCGPVR